MTSIWGCGRPCRERTSKGPLGSSPPLESSHDEGPVNPSVEFFIAKYKEEDLQKILRTVLKVRAPSFDSLCEKLLKARSPHVYCGKSHIECYNFCQPCEDYFATARAKGLSCIPFAAFFLCDRINFRWQQYKRKYEAESTIPIMWKEFKTFLRRSLGDSQAFVNSYLAKIKRDSQYHQEDVLDWATHLEQLQAVL